jgi:leader peptidase (prepilin peptidase)/N-methyltransferase
VSLDSLLAIGLALWLGGAAVIDARRMILPDVLTLPLIPLGLGLAWHEAPPLADRAIGAVAGFAVFALLAEGYRRWRGRDGLGLGDAKLLAGAGAWVGWQSLPSVVLIAALSGLVWALVLRPPIDRPIPFGPFLAFGFWLVWRFGPLGFVN